MQEFEKEPWHIGADRIVDCECGCNEFYLETTELIDGNIEAVCKACGARIKVN